MNNANNERKAERATRVRTVAYAEECWARDVIKAWAQRHGWANVPRGDKFAVAQRLYPEIGQACQDELGYLAARL